MKRLLVIVLTVALLSGLNVGYAVAASEYKILPDDGEAGDFFGLSVDVDGGTAVVGAPNDDENGTDSGSVYVFLRDDSGWSWQAALTPDDGAAGDNFGYSVALDADTAVIGASGDDENGSNSGSAYVFVRNGGSWRQQARLIPDISADGDLFGCSVAIDGDTAVIGAYGDNGAMGSACVFVRDGETWSQQARLYAGDPGSGDNFGYSVSISGDSIMVGAPFNDDNGSNSGTVYEFVRVDDLWYQQARLTPVDGAAGDNFGYAVSIDADTVAVGAPGDDIAGLYSGSAYVFLNSGGSWIQQAVLTPVGGDAYDYFGWSVAVDEDALVVGAPLNDVNGNGSGSACLFSRDGGIWTQQDALIPSDGGAGNFFGLSLSVSGDVALVGAPYDDDNGSVSGSAYAFSLSVNAPPVPGAGGPYTGLEGTPINLDASASYDPDDVIVLYQWDLDADGEFDDADGMIAPAMYADDGVYTIALKVTDSHGAYAVDTASVTVDNAPPSVDAGPGGAVDFGVSFSLGASFTDPGTLDTHSAVIYWGDEASEAGLLTEPDGGPGTVTGSHDYPWPGVYEIVIEVTDSDGAIGIDTLEIEVLAVTEVMVEVLADAVEDIDLPSGKGNGKSDGSSLDTAVKILNDSNPKNDKAAVNNLEAFINKLESQRGKKIPADVADELIAMAQQIIDALNGGA